MTRRASDHDVVIVGGGSAGCVLAARLAEHGARDVLLLEAGVAPTDATALPATTRDGRTLAGSAPGSDHVWDYPAQLAPGRDYVVSRGRVLGGSSAVNGGYFVRPRPEDLDAWAAAGGSAWSWREALPLMRSMETDSDFGPSELHGDAGPMPVSRAGGDHPVAEAFTAAALASGHSEEADKNAPGAPGVGPVPHNITGGVRRSTAMQYALPALERGGLTIRGSMRATRILVESGRAAGVLATDLRTGEAHEIRAREVVLAAGAVATPHLLLASGIGPADDLRAHGVRVAADLPGVGRGFSDHPDLVLLWTASRELPPAAEAPFTTALNLASGAGPAHGDLELLASVSPMSALFPGSGFPDALPIIVGLQAAESRGSIRLASADPEADPRIDYGYLRTAADRALARAGIRAAADLARTDPFADVFGGWLDLPDDLRDDAALDAWAAAHLGTAVHLCGSARMGPDSDPDAVVDGSGRVRGVDGLRVCDTSILPVAPTRGPAASAVVAGEIIARAMRAEGVVPAAA